MSGVTSFVLSKVEYILVVSFMTINRIMSYHVIIILLGEILALNVIQPVIRFEFTLVKIVLILNLII